MTVPGQREIDDTKMFVGMHRDAIRKAVDALGGAIKRNAAAADIVACIGTLGDVVLAAEAMEAATAEAAKKLRAHMATLMELGATRVETGSGTWSLADLPALVEITDPKAVPDEWMKHPEPQPDKTRIAAHLKAGAKINWATLRTGRGSTCRFTPRKG